MTGPEVAAIDRGAMAAQLAEQLQNAVIGREGTVVVCAAAAFDKILADLTKIVMNP